MSYKSRVDTLRILIDSHYTLSGSPKLSQIVEELNRITLSGRMPRHNGWLLAVLHTTRALDTTLSEIVRFKGWVARPPSLGRYLRVLSDPNPRIVR